ncbi:MAG: SRPBCC family protein [Ktedonobacterales bacterium]
MEIKGTYHFNAAPQAVWAGLHNATILQNASGAQAVSWQGENAVTATVSLPSMGPLSGGVRTVTVQVPESTAPSHMSLAFSRGPVNATGSVDLAADGTGTLMTYNTDIQVSGPLAPFVGMAQPMVSGQVKSILEKLNQQIS